MGCVYIITNLINGKQYVGKTLDFKTRKSNHLSYARSLKIKKPAPITLAIHKYGEENFKWEIVFESSNEKELFQYEEKLTIELNTLAPNGYNQVLGGGGSRKQPLINVQCGACGKNIQVRPNKFKYNQSKGFHFACSPECNSKLKSIATTGVNNPNFRNGKSIGRYKRYVP